MDFNGAFSSNMERKEDKYVVWELIHGFGIDYGFDKGNAKFVELDRLITHWSKRLYSLDLLMKYEKWGDYWLKNSEN